MVEELLFWKYAETLLKLCFCFSANAMKFKTECAIDPYSSNGVDRKPPYPAMPTPIPAGYPSGYYESKPCAM